MAQHSSRASRARRVVGKTLQNERLLRVTLVACHATVQVCCKVLVLNREDV